MGLWDRLGSRRPESDPSTGVTVVDPVYGTKALRKFLAAVTAKDAPVILDLGPVIGGNVSFFGEQIGCKILVEDIFSDLDRHVGGNAHRRGRVPQGARRNLVDSGEMTDRCR